MVPILRVLSLLTVRGLENALRQWQREETSLRYMCLI